MSRDDIVQRLQLGLASACKAIVPLVAAVLEEVEREYPESFTPETHECFAQLKTALDQMSAGLVGLLPPDA